MDADPKAWLLGKSSRTACYQFKDTEQARFVHLTSTGTLEIVRLGGERGRIAIESGVPDPDQH